MPKLQVAEQRLARWGIPKHVSFATLQGFRFLRAMPRPSGRVLGVLGRLPHLPAPALPLGWIWVGPLHPAPLWLLCLGRGWPATHMG
jgi:hypothetical protein